MRTRVCPKCGGEAGLFIMKRSGARSDLYWVQCYSCKTRGSQRYSADLAWRDWYLECGVPIPPNVHPMCEAMASASWVGLFVARTPTPATPSAAVGADGPGTVCSLCDGDGGGQWYLCGRCKGTGKVPEAVNADGPVAGDHKEWCDGAKEFCERQVESDTVPRAEYDRVVKLNHHLREVAVMAITERVPSDSKPTNCINPESEDTPPHNPVMGTVVGTANVIWHMDPAVPTVPPEVGKQYVCRNGEVTEAMGAGLRIQTYPFRASVNGVTRTWMRDGKHDESKFSGYDLIAEYNEPEPAGSPDDWVPLTDPKHRIRRVDECRKRNGGVWTPCTASVGGTIGVWPELEFRCRRKDLPTVPTKSSDRCDVCQNWTCASTGTQAGHALGECKVKQDIVWSNDWCDQFAAHPDRYVLPGRAGNRTVTLREYRRAGHSETLWTTSDLIPDSHYTKRTIETEVPE